MWAEHRLAIFFGCLGLVPFLAGAAGLWLWPSLRQLISDGYFLFSAGVLAFMAGVYWPVSMQLDHCAYPVSSMTALLLSQGSFVLQGWDWCCTPRTGRSCSRRLTVCCTRRTGPY